MLFAAALVACNAYISTEKMAPKKIVLFERKASGMLKDAHKNSWLWLSKLESQNPVQSSVSMCGCIALNFARWCRKNLARPRCKVSSRHCLCARCRPATLTPCPYIEGATFGVYGAHQKRDGWRIVARARRPAWRKSCVLIRS